MLAGVLTRGDDPPEDRCGRSGPGGRLRTRRDCDSAGRPTPRGCRGSSGRASRPLRGVASCAVIGGSVPPARAAARGTGRPPPRDGLGRAVLSRTASARGLPARPRTSRAGPPWPGTAAPRGGTVRPAALLSRGDPGPQGPDPDGTEPRPAVPRSEELPEPPAGRLRGGRCVVVSVTCAVPPVHRRQRLLDGGTTPGSSQPRPPASAAVSWCLSSCRRPDPPGRTQPRRRGPRIRCELRC